MYINILSLVPANMSLFGSGVLASVNWRRVSPKSGEWRDLETEVRSEGRCPHEDAARGGVVCLKSRCAKDCGQPVATRRSEEAKRKSLEH